MDARLRHCGQRRCRQQMAIAAARHEHPPIMRARRATRGSHYARVVQSCRADGAMLPSLTNPPRADIKVHRRWHSPLRWEAGSRTPKRHRMPSKTRSGSDSGGGSGLTVGSDGPSSRLPQDARRGTDHADHRRLTFPHGGFSAALPTDEPGATTGTLLSVRHIGFGGHVETKG